MSWRNQVLPYSFSLRPWSPCSRTAVGLEGFPSAFSISSQHLDVVPQLCSRAACAPIEVTWEARSLTSIRCDPRPGELLPPPPATSDFTARRTSHTFYDRCTNAFQSPAPLPWQPLVHSTAKSLGADPATPEHQNRCPHVSGLSSKGVSRISYKPIVSYSI